MNKRPRYYAILSGEHPTLPLEELRAVLEVEAKSHEIVYRFDGLALFDMEGVSPGRIASRTAWVREVGLFLGIAEARPEDLERLAREMLSTLEPGDIWIDPWRFKGYSPQARENIVRRIFMEEAARRGFRTSRRGRMLRIFITEGVAVAGLVVGAREKGYHERRPRRRPFFKPGPLSPELSRVFVNLSRLPLGGTFLDPFCGTGGFALEAYLVGAGRIVCGDIDRAMYRGARLNLGVYECGGCLVLAHNAAKMPLASGVFDSIATDPPYGRSTTTARMGYRALLQSFLPRALDAVKRGGYIVYAGPYSEKPWMIGEEAGLLVKSRFHMYVHSSLTREIVVGVRP